MYKLNTHDLYGPSNDLYRRGGNFEFQFSGPESIPNAVKRYNKQRAAELAQLRKDREPTKQTMPRFCKVRRSGNDVTSMVTSRDLDVETQLSLESSVILDEFNDDDVDDYDAAAAAAAAAAAKDKYKEDSFVRNYEDNWEPRYQRLCGGADGKINNKSKKSKAKPKKKTIADTGDEACQQIEALHREVCAELQFMEHRTCMPVMVKPPAQVAPPPSKRKQSASSPKRRQKKEVKETRKSQPQAKAEEVLARLKVVLNAQRELVNAVSKRAETTQNDHSVHDVQDVQNVQNIQDIQDIQDIQGIQDIQDVPVPVPVPVTALPIVQPIQSVPIVQSIQTVPNVQDGEGDRIHPVQYNLVSYEDYPQQQAQWVDIMPSAMMWQAIQVNVCNVENATPMSAYQFMDQHGSVEPEPMTPFFLEDGDLEHEYENRPGYLRYLEPRPTCPSSEPELEQCPNQICMDPEITAAAGGDQRENRLPVAIRQPCFVELEHRPHRISLLRSMQPMRYTSQRSEETHVPSEEDIAKEKIVNNKMEVEKSDKDKMEKEKEKEKEKVKKDKREGKDGKKGKLEQIKKEKSVENSHTKSMNKKSTGIPTAKSQKIIKQKMDKGQGKSNSMRQTLGPSSSPSGPKFSSNKQHIRRRTKSKSKTLKIDECNIPENRIRYTAGRDVVAVNNNNNMNGSPPSIPAPPSQHTRESMSPIPYEKSVQRRRKQRSHGTLVCSRSLENLKFEKLAIYNKISLTQERIISSLDRLQNSLLQLHVPHCNGLERQRRERNAFEFCVRFARNFLYPLKGMIDDVRNTTVSSYNSAKSNEACQRVVCVYGLIQQSVQTFQRQLRYFLLDKVPQKLSALIEMIYTMTNVCLEKGIMDRQDPVVECLQQRCTKFLTFIEDMQEERFQMARETYRRLKKRGHKINRPRYHQYHRTQSEVRCQRYDLKMCLNDLKFYEPRLVPRKEKRPRPLLRVRKMKGNGGLASGAAGSVAANGVTKISSNAELPPAIDHMVVTQIENIQCRGDASSAMSINTNKLLANFDDHKPSCSRRVKEKKEHFKAEKSHQQMMEQELHEALFEALQHVSKNQVQQVLDPIMRSLETMLQKRVQPTKD